MWGRIISPWNRIHLTLNYIVIFVESCLWTLKSCFYILCIEWVFFHVCKTKDFEGEEKNVYKIMKFYILILNVKQTLKTSAYLYDVNIQCQHSMNFVLNSVRLPTNEKIWRARILDNFKHCLSATGFEN